jgi:hypothetical protein
MSVIAEGIFNLEMFLLVIYFHLNIDFSARDNYISFAGCTVWEIEKEDGGRRIYIFNKLNGHPILLYAHFLADFLLVACLDLDDFKDWLLFDFEIFICFLRSAFFLAATALESLPFDALAMEAFLGTSFYFMTFLEDETFLTTVTFSVFLADTFGFLTGAGLFLVLAATTSFFLGLATCFFSIFFDAFLIYKAFLSEALDFDSLLGLTNLDSLDLDSFCFESFDILDSFYFESFDLDSLTDLDKLAFDFSGVLDFEIFDDFDLLDSLLCGVFN